MKNATENYIKTQKNIAAIDEKAQAVRERIASAKAVQYLFQNARNELEAAKEAREKALTAIHFGENVDLKLYDKDIQGRRERCESLSDAGTGAAGAIAVLQEEVVGLQTLYKELSGTLPTLRYDAAVAEAETTFAHLIKIADECEDAFASSVAALMVLESLRDKNTNGVIDYLPNFNFEISFPNATRLQNAGFDGYRSHSRVLEKAHAKSEQFAAHLEELGVV